MTKYTRGDVDRLIIAAVLLWILGAQLWEMGSFLALSPIITGFIVMFVGLIREHEVNRSERA
jgi:hypothetical protein